MLPLDSLSVLNPHPKKLPGPTLLHQLIRFPTHSDKLALEYLPATGILCNTYTYADLDILSTAFAVKLSAHLPPGNPLVPILLPQSPALYIALLGILKAGAAFVPLPLDAPSDRLQFIARDVAAPVVVTNSTFAHLFTCPVLVVTSEDLDASVPPSFSLQGLLALPGWIDSSATAYIMYTSGSTGTPKGVAISHYAATQSLLAHERHVPAFTRWLQFAAPSFDVFVFEMFFPLFRGRTLVGVDRGRLLANLPGCINQLAVDATELTPTVAGGLLGSRAAVPGLKVLLTIGEMLTSRVVAEFGGGVLQGMYGPTEAAIHCSVAADFPADGKVGDVGVPFDTVSAYIIAPPPSVDVLPLGWVGELAVGGAQLADGYIGRPELTSEVFVDTERYGRIYRTGDRARMLPGGHIEVLGRVGGSQVKLRGQRVELGEVEEVVLRTPGVKGVVASVIRGGMVVFVGGGVNRGVVLETCKQWLPRFMVPGDVVVFEELPRLPSGKADRKRLDREYAAREVVAEDEELGGEEERILVDAVGELLGVRPSRDASLIALGLDSIQAIRLVGVLRSHGYKLEVLDVLMSDTVTGIAALISSRDSEGPTKAPAPQDIFVVERFAAVRSVGMSKIPEQHRKDVVDILPCTSVQAAMLAETMRDASAYCNWILLELSGALDAVVIENAWRDIIERNEILRTGFVEVEDGFAQVIWRTSHVGQFSMCTEYKAEWSIMIEGLLEPPFAATLVKGQDGWEISVRIHHVLYDGWCWEQILADFNMLLGGGTPKARPQFRSVVEYELSRSVEAKEASRVAWKEALEGFGMAKFPSLHAHTAVGTGVGTEELALKVSRASYEAAARGMGVSPQTIVQAAWAFLLSFYVGSTDVVFGTVVSGRTTTMEGVEDVVGPTILTLPVRVDVERGRKVSDVVGNVARRGRECMVSEVGLREIRKVCGMEGPLFESLLVWQQTLEGVKEGMVKMVDSKDRLEVSAEWR